MLSQQSIRSFWENGYCTTGAVLEPAEALAIRERVERFEREHPEAIGKLDLKANLLFPWLDRLSADPRVTSRLEGLLGPNILCHTASFRNKPPDRRTFVSWYQDTTYEQVDPCKIIFWLAVTPATRENGCLRFIPGSHRWGQLRHETSHNPDSMLTHGHYVAERLDEANAVEVVLLPGEAVLFHYAVVHASGPNRSDDRRMALFIDYFAAESIHAGSRESARLVRGVDRCGGYDHEPAPGVDYGAAEVAAHRIAVEKLARNFYRDWDREPEALSGKARNRV